MNQDLTARIQSKYGTTRKIKIRDSIRQGGVLAVVEYANLMDEIAKELGKDKENIITIGNKNMPGCLLWMDDVVLIHHDKHIMQNMIDTTNEIANRYRIQFGQEKSKIMIVGKDKDDDNFKLGQMPLQKTDKYKYLGVILNNKGNLSDHLKQVKGKCEATTQTILDVARNRQLRGREMQTILKLHETCTIPTLLYGTEAMIPTEKELGNFETTHNNIMKRILDTPPTTSQELINLETNIPTATDMINERQIIYMLKSNRKEGNQNTTRKSDPWNTRIQKELAKYQIKEEEMVKCRAKTVKQKVKHKIKEYSNKQIMEATERKSKLKHLVVTSYDNTLDMRKQQPYMNTNNRGECSAIFSTRTLMLKVKENYSSKHVDKSCRFCKTQESETQTHILEKCKEFETEAKYIDQHHLKKATEHITKIEAKQILQIKNKINDVDRTKT